MKKLYVYILLATLFLIAESHYAFAQRCDEKGDPAIYQLLDQKKYSEAEQLAKKGIAKQPNNVQAHKDFAAVYIRWATKEIVQVDESVLGLKPGEGGTVQLTPELVDKAFKSRLSFDPALMGKAENALSMILDKWPKQRESYFCLMELQQKSERHQEFLKTLDRTARTFQKEGNKIIDDLLGAIYYYGDELGRMDLAAESYETALKVFSDSSKLLSSYGASQVGLGFVRKGMSFFLKAYEKDQNDPIILHNLGEAAMLMKDFSSAEKYYLKGFNIEPAKTDILFDIAMIKMADGPEKSIPAWNRYLTAHEKHPDVETWSKAGRQIKERAEAGMTTEEVFQLAQEMIRGKAGKYAVPLMVYAETQDPKEAAYPYVLAQAYDTGGYFDLAWDELVKTAMLLEKEKSKYSIERTHVYFNLARTGYSINRFKESIKYLKLIERKDPNYPNLQYFIGKVTIKIGDLKAAKQYFEQCLKSPNNKEYAEYCKSNLEDL